LFINIRIIKTIFIKLCLIVKIEVENEEDFSMGRIFKLEKYVKGTEIKF